MEMGFLPISKQDMAARGWQEYDFLLITGDAYVDHPSFGPAVISRVLEAEGYRVAVLAQPDWRKLSAFTMLGRPRLGVFISAGNLDSMVAHYTAAKRRRHDDAYSPGGKAALVIFFLGIMGLTICLVFAGILRRRRPGHRTGI